MSEKILVLGATGILGQPVVQCLVEDGVDVRILARDAGRAQKILGDAFEIIEGDATQQEDLKRALAGCSGVHISLPSEQELIAIKHIASLAPGSDLDRLTYVSATTAKEENRWFEMIDVKLRSEALLRESGVPLTTFCPTWVMEILHNFVHGERAVAITGKRPIPLHFFAAEEFGRRVATAYSLEETIGKRLYIHGPEAISLRKAIDHLVTTCYPNIKKVTVMPVWFAKLFATFTGRKPMAFVSRLIGYFDKVGESGDPAEANILFGAPHITLETWCKTQSRRDRKRNNNEAWTPPSG